MKRNSGCIGKAGIFPLKTHIMASKTANVLAVTSQRRVHTAT